MTTDETPPVTPGADTPTPVTAHGYLCDDCLAPTPALEVHSIGPGDWLGYCARCAPTWRPYAHVVLGADLAHQMGVTITLEHIPD